MNCEHFEQPEPDCEPEPEQHDEEIVNIMFIEDKEPVWSFWPWLVALFLVGMLLGAIIFGHGKKHHHDPVPVPCPTTTSTTIHRTTTTTVPTTMIVTN